MLFSKLMELNVISCNFVFLEVFFSHILFYFPFGNIRTVTSPENLHRGTIILALLAAPKKMKEFLIM